MKTSKSNGAEDCATIAENLQKIRYLWETVSLEVLHAVRFTLRAVTNATPHEHFLTLNG